MFDQFAIIRLKEELKRTILQFQIYCVSHDTQEAGYKSLTPLVKIDNNGYEDQLALNKDLKEQIHRCQIQLQTLLEIVENDNDALLEKLGHVKPTAKPATHSISKDSGDDSDTFNL